MEILSAIVQLLGGLALFLYGIELMGDGLKNSSGAALKRVLEKVTGNVVMGVLTGALVTAVIQSSTATIVLTVALIGAGVLNLRQAVSIVMGANIGTTVTAQIIRRRYLHRLRHPVCRSEPDDQRRGASGGYGRVYCLCAVPE